MKALFTLPISYLTSNSRFQRLLMFGSSNESNPPLHDLESPPPPATTVAAMDVKSTSSLLAPANTNSAEATAASLAELAIPAMLSLAIYATIPPVVQLDHGRLSLYHSLVVSVDLALFTSVGSIMYTLVKSLTTSGVRENISKMVMSVALAFLLIAFVLRAALLL